MTTKDITPLAQIYFYMTEGCNLACKHCWLNPPVEKGELRHSYLSVKDFEQAIDEALKLGLAHIKLTGGEPLLHPQIKECLFIAEKKNVKILMETNGILLNEEFVFILKSIPLMEISVSLDGINAETHDDFRGVPGAFDKTLNGINLLSKANIPFQIITSLTRRNMNQIADIILLADAVGAMSFKLNLIQPTSRGLLFHEGYNRVEIKDIIMLVEKLRSMLIGKVRLQMYFDLPFAFRSISSISNGASGRCGIKSIIGVLPSGHYALCGIGSHIKELVFGKIGDTPLEDVWLKNKILLDIRSGLPQKLEGICKRCLMKRICLGSCLAQNYFRKKSLWASFWFCEEAYRQGLFPESRLMTG